jgi:acetyl esterase/lipase
MRTALTAALLLTVPMPALAQGLPPARRIAAPAERGAIALSSASGSAQGEQWDDMTGMTLVRNVTQPALTPFLPDPGKATGAAVIVAPGGAFMMLAIDHEGWQVARWLADHGVAAFVLKYRVNPTPADDAAFTDALNQLLARVASPGAPPVDPQAATHPSTEDALAAIQLVRARASEWKVDPKRVGLLGFSAGAILTERVALYKEAAARPDFVAPIYPPMTAVTVPSDAPPMFTAVAADDELFGHSGFGLVEAWRKAGRPIEFHYYDGGGHGFGMTRKNTTSDLWIDEFYAWMKARGWLSHSG